MDFLAGRAREVAERVVREEEGHRRHLVIYLSGAHAYGFPSPDSDLDLKAIHVEPTKSLLGLADYKETFDRLEVIDGVEIDYTSNEIKGVLAGIIAGNGNYIERVIGNLFALSGPEHQELAELMPRLLSRRVHRHYRGFAANQRRSFELADKPTAKKLLYVLRTALTGTHLLRTGELRVDLTTIAEDYGFADAHDLIEAKKAGERAVLAEDVRQSWLERLDGLFEMLDDARERSVLPEEAPGASEAEDWLVQFRAAQLAR
ncbi:MAG: nucleotidyltransferase domain-containing protein [Deltaproteobacteria bacterium]|jgi:predicted nucleotidyltransferase|nr:nucleotidyltransferase domain-containing protein [Deltaproteobacteria bacterium]